MIRIAYLIHGFYCTPDDMEEIFFILKESQEYEYIFNLDLYASKRGANFFKYPNLLSPIHSDDYKKMALDRFILHQILETQAFVCNETNCKEVIIDFYCHSLGGLVLRSILQKLLMPSPTNHYFYIGRGRVRNIVTLGTAHHGSYLAKSMAPAFAPLQAIAGMSKLFLRLYDSMTLEMLDSENTAHQQFFKASEFIKELNFSFYTLPSSIRWISVAGELEKDQFEQTPRIKKRIFESTPNDGVIEVSSTLLPGFRGIHVVIKRCNHKNLLRWRTTTCGKQVWNVLKSILFNDKD